MPYGEDSSSPKVRQMIAQPVRKIPSIALAITVLGLMFGCASTPPSAKVATQSTRSGQAPVGLRAASIALDQVGVPYRYGGSSPSGFDCSGLVQYSYGRVGKTVPRTTGQLWNATRPVSRSDLQHGDLLFFNVDGKMSHVGMYVGERQFVHAPSSGRSVSVASLDSPYYRQAFVRGGRLR